MTQTPLAPIAAHENFIQRFGDWITGVFEHSQSLYNQLEDEAKKAAIWGSGLIASVNSMLTALPADVIAFIKQKFPDLSLDTVHGFLDILRTKLDNLSTNIPLTLEEAVKWLQGFLSAHKSNDHSIWSTISAAASTILATLFSPGTLVEKFISIGLWVYHIIVAPHVTGATA